MVNKNLGLVDELIFADVHESYNQHQSEEIYESIFEQEDFRNSKTLLLTGGPNETEEIQRKDSLVEYVQEFRDNRESIPEIFTTTSQIEKIRKDERINESDYIFRRIDPESSVDEIEAVEETLSAEDEVVVFTSDYHVPRYESELNSHLDDSVDYLVFGAKLSSHESDYGEKWRSEAISTALPQKLKDYGKKFI